MAQFLDLPREIRDIIYAYIFLSPSSASRALVSFLPTYKIQRGKSTLPIARKSQVSFVLIANPHDVFDSYVNQDKKIINPIETSLSIVRVCRQIHEETHGRFWAENTLYFPNHAAGANFRWMNKSLLSVSSTLKGMGQTASRFITHIRLDMSGLDREVLHYHDLPRVLSTLASRARHGQFKYLELSWLNDEAVEVFGCLAQGQSSPQSPWCDGYATLIQALENGTDVCKYERVIKFPSVDVLKHRFENPRGAWDAIYGYEFEHMDGMAAEMHMAFGGKLFWGDELSWDKGVCKLSVLQKYGVGSYGNEPGSESGSE